MFKFTARKSIDLCISGGVQRAPELLIDKVRTMRCPKINDGWFLQSSMIERICLTLQCLEVKLGAKYPTFGATSVGVFILYLHC